MYLLITPFTYSGEINFSRNLLGRDRGGLVGKGFLLALTGFGEEVRPVQQILHRTDDAKMIEWRKRSTEANRDRTSIDNDTRFN